ncbi:MAG: hypothetical protein M0R49_01795 [Limnochordia bacterium]|nr:hypothetical protein [Limnochordia bacterium]
MMQPSENMSRDRLRSLADNISRVIVGKEEVTELLLTSLLARGHCLIDDEDVTRTERALRDVWKSVLF